MSTAPITMHRLITTSLLHTHCTQPVHALCPAIIATRHPSVSAGELAIKAQPEELAGLAMPVLERLVPILSAPMGAMPRSILENSAITLGRWASESLTVVEWLCLCRADSISPAAHCGAVGVSSMHGGLWPQELTLMGPGLEDSMWLGRACCMS